MKNQTLHGASNLFGMPCCGLPQAGHQGWVPTVDCDLILRPTETGMTDEDLGTIRWKALAIWKPNSETVRTTNCLKPQTQTHELCACSILWSLSPGQKKWWGPTLYRHVSKCFQPCIHFSSTTPGCRVSLSQPLPSVFEPERGARHCWGIM